MKKSITALLISVCVFLSAGCATSSQTAKVLLGKGPWAEKAIWIDDGSQLCLISTKGADDPYANVPAVLLIGDQWLTYQLNLRHGTNLILFDASDGDTVLEARATIKDGTLHLFDFETSVDDLVIPYTTVELTKFSYQEQADKLPFDIG